VAVNVTGAEAKGTVGDDGRLENPSNPYWPYVISKVGTLKIAKSGPQKLTLKPETIEAQNKFGLTLVAVKLTPTQP